MLASRRGDAFSGADSLREALSARGTRVMFAACDVSDASELELLIGRIDRDGLPLRVVAHLAGVGTIAPVTGIELAELRREYTVKARGGWLLHQAVRGRALDAFILYGSGAALWGGATQGAYGAANAALDGLARYRRSHGEPALVVHWGTWSGGGMLSQEGDAQLRRRGVLAMDPQKALRGLEFALLGGRTSLGVFDLDWSVFAPAYNAARTRPLLDGVAEARAALEPTRALPGVSQSELLRELARLPESDRRTRVRALLASETAAVLGVSDPDSLSSTKGFVDLGFDSLMALELSKRLQDRLGVPVPKTLSFDHPNLDQAASFVLRELLTSASELQPSSTHERADGAADEALAVVGVGMRLPGGIETLEDLWSFLAAGRDAVREIPNQRVDLSELYDADPEAEGKSYVRNASLLDDVAGFDADFFGMSPREAAPMDPQHRLLLETGWSALEDAGLRPGSLRDTDAGVFVGAAPGEYAFAAAGSDDTYALTGSVPSFNAGRVSYHLGLQGPALTVDTACSSSLVAVQLACSALRRGECKVALAARRAGDRQSGSLRGAESHARGLTRRPLQDVLCGCRRLRPWRRCRRAGADAALGCEGGRSANPGSDPRSSRQSRWHEQRHHCTQRDVTAKGAALRTA